MAWHGITHAVPLGQRVLAQHLLSHEEGQSPVKFSVSTRQLFRVVSTPWNMKYDCNRHKKMRNCAFFSRPELLSLRSLRLLLSNLELVDLQMLLSLQVSSRIGVPRYCSWVKRHFLSKACVTTIMISYSHIFSLWIETGQSCQKRGKSGCMSVCCIVRSGVFFERPKTH